MRGKKLGEGKWVVVVKSFISRDQRAHSTAVSCQGTGERREGIGDSEEGTGDSGEGIGTAEKGQGTEVCR